MCLWTDSIYRAMARVLLLGVADKNMFSIFFIFLYFLYFFPHFSSYSFPQFCSSGGCLEYVLWLGLRLCLYKVTWLNRDNAISRRRRHIKTLGHLPLSLTLSRALYGSCTRTSCSFVASSTGVPWSGDEVAIKMIFKNATWFLSWCRKKKRWRDMGHWNFSMF